MKKILIIIDSYQGGAGNIAQLLAGQLFCFGYKVCMLLTNNNGLPRYDMYGIEEKKATTYDGKNKILRFFSSFSRMKKDIKSISPDLIVSFLTATNVIASFSAKRLSVPIVVCERSNPLVIKPALHWRFLRRVAYRKANVVTVQFNCFRHFDNNRYFSKCMVIPNIVNTPFVLKQNYSLVNRKAFTVVAVGRLHPIKNYSAMLRIIKKTKERGINIFLDIFGDGEEKKKLEFLSSTLGIQERIRFCGYVHNPCKNLDRYDAFLMTSIQEGFPNALSEAMAVGLPCVSFSCHDGFKELICNGNNGMLVEDYNEENFVDALEKLYLNGSLRSKIGNNAKKISFLYSKERIMVEWNKIIKKAMNP